MLSKKDILEYFEELNRRLWQRNIHGELLLAGGAALSLVYNARESTQDIDAVFKPSKAIRNVILEMAEEDDLEEDWLNDGVKGFIDTEKIKIEVYLEYSNLKINVINAEGLLAMKLTSARDNEKDLNDSIVLIKKLDIKTIEEVYEIIERLLPKTRQTPQSFYFTQYAFENYLETKQEQRVSLFQESHDVKEASAEIEVDSINTHTTLQIDQKSDNR